LALAIFYHWPLFQRTYSTLHYTHLDGNATRKIQPVVETNALFLAAVVSLEKAGGGTRIPGMVMTKPFDQLRAGLHFRPIQGKR
jgi:hypothetical protein